MLQTIRASVYTSVTPPSPRPMPIWKQHISKQFQSNKQKSNFAFTKKDSMCNVWDTDMMMACSSNISSIRSTKYIAKVFFYNTIFFFHNADCSANMGSPQSRLNGSFRESVIGQ